MKHVLVIVSVFFTLLSSALAQSNVNYKSFNPGLSNDTLLFDGDSPQKDPGSADNCPVKVTYSKGQVKGKRIVQKKFQICNDPGLMNVEEDANLGEGDVLAPGSTISTGDNSAVQLQMLDGSIMRVGPNSSFTLGDCNFDDQTSTFNIKDLIGQAWQSVQHALGGDVNYGMSTGNATAGVRGTKYSLEYKVINGDSTTILRVYEGVVNLRASFDRSDIGKEIASKTQKLFEDYQAGKLTLQDYTMKVQELNTLNEVSKFNIDVQAGFETMVAGGKTPTEPKPFTPDDNAWFADKNFTK